MISLDNSEKLFESASPMFSPFEHDDGLFFISQNGDLFSCFDGNWKIQFQYSGHPCSCALDRSGQNFYIADSASQCILKKPRNKEVPAQQFIKKFETFPLLGPNTVLCSRLNIPALPDSLVFTDSGPLGESTISAPKGSIFEIDLDDLIARPLALRCLAYPTGLAYSEDERILYLSETGNNRVLRFFQTEQGTYYFSPFYQFSGRFGPTALSVSQGRLFASLFEFKGISSQGCIAVLGMKGELLANIKLASIGPEISGLYIPHKSHMLYLTQNSGKPSFIRALIQRTEDEDELLKNEDERNENPFK